MSDPAPTPTPTPTPAPAPTPTPPWYSAHNDPEFTGYLQMRGLDKKDPAEAAFETYKSHRHAEKMMGAPADQLLRLPKDGDSEGWAKVYERLGRPTKADEYDFKEIKASDGKDLDDESRTFFRNVAFKHNLTKEQAAGVIKDFIANETQLETAENTEAQAKVQAEQQALKKNWGAAYDANKFIAAQAAVKLGFTPDIVTTLEKAAGYTAVMNALHKAGIALGEDKFIANMAPGANGLMSKEQAKARMQELKNDKDWQARWRRGDTAAIREFDAVTAMMVGQAA